MAHVVQASCINCKYGDCVEVCPTEAFYEGPTQLFINPVECISCDACREQCPVSAIAAEESAEPEWLQKNAEFDYTPDKKRTSKKQVSHGPNWDATKGKG